MKTRRRYRIAGPFVVKVFRRKRGQKKVTSPSEVLEGGGLLTVQRAAERLGVSRATLYVIMGAGHLQWVKIGRARRIPEKALQDFAWQNLKGGWNVDERKLKGGR